jgi:hypothetical protein
MVSVWPHDEGLTKYYRCTPYKLDRTGIRLLLLVTSSGRSLIVSIHWWLPLFIHALKEQLGLEPELNLGNAFYPLPSIGP